LAVPYVRPRAAKKGRAGRRGDGFDDGLAEKQALALGLAEKKYSSSLDQSVWTSSHTISANSNL